MMVMHIESFMACSLYSIYRIGIAGIAQTIRSQRKILRFFSSSSFYSFVCSSVVVAVSVGYMEPLRSKCSVRVSAMYT